MTQQETRNLGIEFERRLIEIWPDFQIASKLDTDTIYSFLNEFQNKYIQSMFVLQEKIDSQTPQGVKIASVIQTLRKSITPQLYQKGAYISNTDSINDFYLYIDSYCQMSRDYKKRVLPFNTARCIHVFFRDLYKYTPGQGDKGRIIRNPLVAFGEDNKCYIVYDQYCQIGSFTVEYYAKPPRFNVDNTPCILPSQCSDEIVNGAVEMYIADYKFKLSGLGRKEQNKQNNTNTDEEPRNT